MKRSPRYIGKLKKKNKRKINEYIFILLHVFKIREDGNEGKKKRREERKRKEG